MIRDILHLFGISAVVWFAAIAVVALLYCGAWRRAAVIALAIAGPVLVVPVLLRVFAVPILSVDAAMVSGLIGTAHVGNIFSAVNGDRFVIHPGCSSLHGISIAILAWVTFGALATGSNLFGRPSFMCGAAAVATVLAINVMRLSLIGLFPADYNYIHGSPGCHIASLLSAATVVAISLVGSGHKNIFRRKISYSSMRQSSHADS